MYKLKEQFFLTWIFCCLVVNCKDFDVSRFYTPCDIKVSVSSSLLCCHAEFLWNSKTVRSCAFSDIYGQGVCKAGNYFRYGCLLNYMPDARFAHPLGMQSGLIKTNQMTYAGEKQSNTSLARLFGPYGWRPGDAYLNANKLSLIIASLNVKGLLAAKVYFQVDFGRMKKIDYFIIQDSKISSTTYTQTFFMLANVSEMRYYGLTGGVKPFNGNPQPFSCKYQFGHPLLSCRHILFHPFRAYSVRMIGQSYSMDHKPEWRLEFGGIDYLEADHYWPLDKIMFRQSKQHAEIPDERGTYVMSTTLTTYISPSATQITYASDIEELATVAIPSSWTEPPSVPFMDPYKCQFGISVSFWLKTRRISGIAADLLASRKTTTATKGFQLKWTNKNITVGVWTLYKYWLISYTVPECTSTDINACNPELRWLHVAAVWNKVSLSVFINGILFETDTAKDNIQSIASRGDKIKIGNILLIREVKLWDWVLSTDEVKEMYESASIDFRITAMDDFGDWNAEAGCTETEQTGPCKDQFFTANPPENIGALYHRGFFVDFSFFSDNKCPTPFSTTIQGTASVEPPYGVAITHGYTISVDHHFNYAEMKSFKIHFKAGSSALSKVQARIYTVSSFNFDGKFQVACRASNFRSDVYNGPVNWDISPVASGVEFSSPDIKEIIKPLLGQINSHALWRHYFFVVIEFLQTRGMSFSLALAQKPYYVIMYADKRPEKYLYADATTAPYVGYPLKYTTRPLIPKMKCLSFWYYMYGSGIGILSVNIRQRNYIYKEIFRLYGDQGAEWRSGSVPLTGLNETAEQFQVTFNAIRGETTAGDIAIDTIKINMTNCSYFPAESEPPRYLSFDAFQSTMMSLNMPVPRILLPLDTSMTYLANQSSSVNQLSSVSKPVTDMHGFPVMAGYFNSSEHVIKMRTDGLVNMNGDFTISFHIRFEKLGERKFFWIGDDDPGMCLRLKLKGGNSLSINFRSGSGLVPLTSASKISKNSWNYLVLVYTRNDGLLKTYFNNTLTDEFDIGILEQFLSSSRILVGGYGSDGQFFGHIACFQVFDIAVDANVVPAMKVCPDKHGIQVCKNKCKEDGVCDQLSRKCVCPSYSNKYTNGDCSNALNSTLYKNSSTFVSFHSRIKLQNQMGHVAHYGTTTNAENDKTANNRTHFTTKGPVNLAFCTKSYGTVSLKELQNDCITQNNCVSSYSISFWILLPSRIVMAKIGRVDVMNIGPVSVEFGLSDRSNDHNKARDHALLVNLTGVAHTCQWYFHNRLHNESILYGVWTHITISVQKANEEISAYFNGQLTHGTKRNCLLKENLKGEAELGGSLPIVCFDEIVFWHKFLSEEDASKLHNAIAYSGYEKKPRKGIIFAQLAFDDETSTLWAIDTSDRIYFYHPKHYWIEIGGLLAYMSNGRNGVWGVNKYGQVYRRLGITEEFPAGTGWEHVKSGGLASMSLNAVISGYTLNIMFAIKTNNELVCLVVNEDRSIGKVSTTNGYFKDLTCSRHTCCGYGMNNITNCFKTQGFTCGTTLLNAGTLTGGSYKATYLSTDSIGTFFRLNDDKLYRQLYDETWIEINNTSESPKAVLSMSGHPVVITKDGELKMLDNEARVFRIFHSSGFCVRYGKDALQVVAIHLAVNCDLFLMTTSGCIKHIATQKYLQVQNVYNYIILGGSTCTTKNKGFKKDPYSVLSTVGRFVSPVQPLKDFRLKAFASISGYGIQVFEFYFRQATAFQSINSFYPRKKIEGTVRGEVMTEIEVSFRFRDLQYHANFRDLSGMESKLIHPKVEDKMKQIFAESNSFVKSSFGEISSGEQSSLACPARNPCTKPLDVKFKGYLYFSYISSFERDILVSDEFKGIGTYCQDFECSFQLSATHKKDLATPANIVLVNKTMTSLTLQYYARNGHGAHIGYELKYKGVYKANRTKTFQQEYIIQDGLQFTISSLHLYTEYELTITPSEVQMVLASILRNFTTQEGVPTTAPQILLQEKRQHSCSLYIKDLIPNENWQGTKLGYHYFYAPLQNLTDSLKTIFSESQKHFFQLKTNNDSQQRLFNISQLETFTQYVFYVGGFTNTGMGPVTRTECLTLEGVPTLPPTDLKIFSINSTYVKITWQPLPPNPWSWKTFNTSKTGYNIYFKETSYPAIEYGNKTVFVEGNQTSFTIIGPLGVAREFAFEIAATNHIGASKKTDQFCVKMPDGAPGVVPSTLSIISKTDTSFDLSVGELDFQQENGKIVYYNISVRAIATNGNVPKFFRLNITEMKLTFSNSSNATCEQITRTCPSSLNAAEERRLAVHSCPIGFTLIRKTSTVVNHTITGLSYWTEYEIKASACTCAGCGPFNIGVHRTDEHTPTCSTDHIDAISNSSTSLSFSWKPLLFNCTHGNFAGYRIYFGPASAFKIGFDVDKHWKIFDANLKQSTYYTESMLESFKVGGLIKYSTYCIAVMGSTAKGYGPASNSHCKRTLTDRPDGPPRNVSVKLAIGATVEVKMRRPLYNLQNGIIEGYVIYYSEKSSDGVPSNEMQMTAKRGSEKYTKASVRGLKAFSFYQFEVVAYTSAGEGKRTYQFVYIQTFEDVPGAAPRNLSLSNKTDFSADLRWLQSAKLNGIFRKFKVIIEEILADNTYGDSRTFHIDANMTSLKSNSNNTSKLIPVYHYNIRKDLTPGVKVSYDNNTEYFSFRFIGLRPFTNYVLNISSCTNPGCGDANMISFRSNETEPSQAPDQLQAYNASESTRLRLSWQELPILVRNGVITAYSIKWMKLCHYIQIFNISNAATDCRRVLNENITSFEVQLVPSTFVASEISNLSSYTEYIIKISALTSIGPGPEAQLIALTAEDTPSQAPIIVRANDTSGKSINIVWYNIPMPYRNGILLGYTIFYRLTDKPNLNLQQKNCTVHILNTTQLEITGLSLFSNYTFSIAGYTSKGLGVITEEFIVKTGPYVHGNWSEWTRWSSCSKSCGGGSRDRKRLCTHPSPWNGGNDCEGNRTATEICNTRPCSGMSLANLTEDCITYCKRKGLICQPKIDLEDSAATFQALGAICSDTTSLARWQKTYHPAYVKNIGLCAGFRNIPKFTYCNATPPIDGYTQRLCNCFEQGDIGYSEWASWSYCSKSCGRGEQISRRECMIPNGACTGKPFQVKDCNTTPCPVDGNWGSWSAVQECNKTCGYGYQHRYRKCDNPPKTNGGEPCYGPAIEYIRGCNPHLCPIHGGWSDWEGNSVCDQSCGGGLSIRRRYCDNPRPQFNGNDCQGLNNITKACNMHQCRGVQVLFWFRLTDIKWNYRYYSKSSQITQDLSAKVKENVFLAYEYAKYVSAVKIEQFRNKFPSKRSRRAASGVVVVANIAVFYTEATQSEILYLQDYVASNGKVFSLSVTESSAKTVNVLSEPPRNLTGTALDPNTIQVKWNPPVNISHVENVTNYYIFYREVKSDIGQWNVRGIPLGNSSFNITRLKAVTSYRIRMTVSVSYGNGPASDEIVVQTPEGVPTEPPKNLKLQATQPSQMYVQWDSIAYNHFNGIPLGYIVKYKHYHEPNYHEVKVRSGSSELTLYDLEGYHFYVVIVYGYTAVGSGPGISLAARTLEGVPSVSPPGVQIKHRIALDSIIVTWQAINEDQANGRFVGYKIKYVLSKVSGKDVVGSNNNIKNTVVDKYTFRLKIKGLQPYTVYSVSVCGYTMAGNGPSSKPIMAETCRCPPEIFLNWYESRPYVFKDRAGNAHGLFKDIAYGMIENSCDRCNGIAPRINIRVSPSGENPEKLSELQVKGKLERGYHLSFPIFGRAEMTSFMEIHKFVALVTSPGSAMIVTDAIDFGAKTFNAFKSVTKVWPMLVIVLLLSIIVGTLLWSVEQFNNEEFTRGKYVYGVCQGLWWAYVSMTTVGYGDITPRSVPGKIIAMIWTLVGLVLTGILTGALTSTVTSLTIPVASSLYGAKAAVINNSFEYRLAVRRNAEVKPAMQFQTATQVLTAVQENKVSVGLLDAFVTAGEKSKVTDMKLKVTKVISANTGFGFVLSKELVYLENDFRSHISSQQALIMEFVANMTNQLEVSNAKPPKIQLFDPKTPVFWLILKYEVGTFLVFTLLGVLWSLFRYYRKHRKVAASPDDMMLFVDAFEDSINDFYERTNEKAEQLTRLHNEEREKLTELKKNFKRQAKRARKSTVWFS